MSKHKKKIVHASRLGTKRPLCDKLQGKVSRDPGVINCVACGRAAQAIVERAEETVALEAAASLHGRQEAALASAQPPRWWEAPDA